MCGIAGIIDLTNQAIDQKDLRRMNALLKHRGPDDEGVFIDGNVGLAHVRLSILDLSSRGHQPMMYESPHGRSVITYNGEIYNFQEIRADLQGKGYKFTSNSDTEVILASYMEYGYECVHKFNGMFSFIIYDIDNQIIFGARDRFGKKPLKYYIDDEKFIFSSELKAILITQKIKRNVDFHAIDDFLTLQYIPAPKTGFKNIHKLTHGHYFTLDLRSRNFHIEKYFDLEYIPKLKMSDQEWIEAIEKQLKLAVEKRLISDVPLGVFLSGGLDSSIITAIMSKYIEKVKTFSIAFDEHSTDESKYSRRVAELYSTEHTELQVKSKDLLRCINDLVYQYEEPFADNAALATYILAKRARQDVTVVLSGDGGDEAFAGYNKYRVHLFVEMLKPLITILSSFEWLINVFNFVFKNQRIYLLSLALRTIRYSLGRRHYNYTSNFDEYTKKSFYRDEFKDCITNKHNPFEKCLEQKEMSEIDKLFYLDLNTYLVDNNNVKVDIASMASSLEVRMPLLDYELVTLGARMYWRQKMSLHQGKKILKRVAEKYLPDDIVYRKKHGFGLPIKEWLRRELRGFAVKEIMDENGLVMKMLKRGKVAQLINEHMTERKNNASKVWTLLMLNLWYKKYFCNTEIGVDEDWSGVSSEP